MIHPRYSPRFFLFSRTQTVPYTDLNWPRPLPPTAEHVYPAHGRGSEPPSHGRGGGADECPPPDNSKTKKDSKKR